MPVSNISKRLAAEASQAVDLSTGLSGAEKEQIKKTVGLAEAVARIEDQAIPELNRQMIRQRIKVDMFNIIERFVELTPSMCSVPDCGFDAAREMGKDSGISDWSRLPLEYELPGGKTVAERAIELKEYHEATAHTVSERNSHIISEGELKRRQQTQSAVFSTR